MNYTEKGSKLYLFSIVLVAVIGGLLFGYDTAVISGAEKGLQAFFMGADFEYTDAIHGITSSSALIGCIIGSAVSGFFASGLGRKNSLFLAGIQFLPCLGRYRCGAGFRHLSDVHCRNRSEQHSRNTGVVESVCHYLRSVGGLLCQLPYSGQSCQSGDRPR